MSKKKQNSSKNVNIDGQAYWNANLKLIAILLSIWALVSLVIPILLAQPLYNIYIADLPFSFWMAQQGSIITFVCLIFTYAYMMDRIDKEHNVHD